MFLREFEREMCERAARLVPIPEWYRANGDVLCRHCGRVYYEHPNAVPHLWLRLVCDGRYVKL
jgi:hypothetical protein